VSRWKYLKIRLNDYDRKSDEIELLCDAGEEGWELVVILPNNVAYLKRPVDAFAQETTDQREHASTQIRTIVAPSTQSSSSTPPPAVRAQEVKLKYCDPKTNDTWSGRGRMALWLKRKQESGEDIEKYRV
jgi:DNA-binding protein H-NS